MQHTYAGLLTLQPPRRTSRSESRPSAPSSPTVVNRAPTDSLRMGAIDEFSFSPTRQSGSTVWGPGALTGKLLKRLGQSVERGAEYVIIRKKLSSIAKMQPNLLGEARRLRTDEAAEMEDQCDKLVDLCITGMGYPPRIMTQAFGLILSGFKLPGRQIWTYYITEAISKREIINVFEIFQDCFFALLDDSIFRIDGVVDLETHSFRCPAVAHEIATIISLLARKDRNLSPHFVSSPSSLSLPLSSETAVEDVAFSSAIIRAGFFRLVKFWAERGLPHWDRRGVDTLEVALKDIAEAQEYHGDLERNAEDARDLVQRLQARRMLSLDEFDRLSVLEHVEEVPEPEEPEIEEIKGSTAR